MLVLLVFSTLNFHLSGIGTEDVKSEWIQPWSTRQTSTCHLKMRDNENQLCCDGGTSIHPSIFYRWRRNVCFFNPGWRGKKPSTPICKMRHDERKGMFLIYQKRIKMALSPGTCWSETNCHWPSWIFQVTFNWKWTIQFSGGSLCRFLSLHHREDIHFGFAW